ncbi:MAG: TetR/AcrR family transcriptional regulator [Gemmataceae bacterium]
MRKGERKRQLLAAAKALAVSHGYAALTPDALTAAAEISPGRLARYFADREVLLRATLDDLRADLFPPPAADEPPDSAGRLQAMLERSLTAARKRTPGIKALIQALTEFTTGDARAEMHARLLEWSEPLVQLIHEGQQSGVFRRSLDAQVTAWDLVQSILGHALIGPRDATTDSPPLDSLWQGVMKVDV